MGVIKFLRDISGLFNWNTDDNPTSEQDYMNAVKNWQETEKNLVDTVLWQPLTEYSVGNVVKTPSLPSQSCLVCATAGTSGANEPTYSGSYIVTDGSVTWHKMTVGASITGYSMSDYDKSLTASTATELISLSLSAGTWVVTGTAEYKSVTSGNRYAIAIENGVRFAYADDSVVAINAGGDATIMCLSTTRIIELNSPATVYLVGYSNTTATVNPAQMHAVRIC